MNDGRYGPLLPSNAGQGPGPAGPQQWRRWPGRPVSAPIGGYLHAQEAAKKRSPVSPPGTTYPTLSPDEACRQENFIARLCDCIVESLLNVQTTARRPSHIDVPFCGICFDKHAGTGAAGSADPPIVLAPVGVAGAFTDLVFFTVPDAHRGVVNGWGTTVDPLPSLPFIEYRLVKGLEDREVAPFDSFYGAQPAAAVGHWFGPPFTLLDMDRDLCVNLKDGDIITLQARNTQVVGAVNVAARIVGWIYPPFMDTNDGSIRATLTDLR